MNQENKVNKDDLKKVGKIGFEHNGKKYNLFRYFWSPDKVEGGLEISITIPKKYTNITDSVYYLKRLRAGKVVERHKSYSKLLKISFHSSGAYHISGENMPNRSKNPYAMKASFGGYSGAPLGFMYTDDLSSFIHSGNITDDLNTRFIVDSGHSTIFVALYRVENTLYRRKDGMGIPEELRDHIISSLERDKDRIGICLEDPHFIPLDYPGNTDHIFLLACFRGNPKPKEIMEGTFVGTYAYEADGDALSLYVNRDDEEVPEIKRRPRIPLAF